MLCTSVDVMFTEQPDGDNCARHGEYGTCVICDAGYYESGGNCAGK